MRHADNTSHVIMNADVLIAEVIRKFNFRKNNLLYFLTLYGDLYSNLACSIVLKNKKNSIFYNAKKLLFKKTAFSPFGKIFGIIEFLKF